MLFIVFSRPDTTSKVFEAIRQAKPPRLYVAADAAREENPDELDRVQKVRKIATSVDWPCEVHTLFQKENLGCRYGPNLAIDWFFEHEREGIILEDDCLPEPGFFAYCEWALDKFRDEKAIWQINGNNFAAPAHLYRGNIDFVSLPQAWGWASWADRWLHQICNPFFLQDATTPEIVRNWQISRVARLNKASHLETLKRGLDTWDYQWHMVVLNHKGLVISPRQNQISNIGDGGYATHTKANSPKTGLRTRLFEFQDSDVQVSLNRRLTGWYEQKMGLASRKKVVKEQLRHVKNWPMAMFQNFIRFVVYFNTVPIVVASSGRSGSSLLTNSICESIVRKKVWFAPGFVKRWLIARSSRFVDRLDSRGFESYPVVKTHDLLGHTNRRAKYIFAYGDPLEAALSVLEMGKEAGRKWIDQHIYNLHGQGTSFEILEKDVLNYEGQLKSWGFAEGVFVVHYDEIWDKVAELEAFLGFPVRLPERRNRSEKTRKHWYNSELFQRLRMLEAKLRQRSGSGGGNS